MEMLSILSIALAMVVLVVTCMKGVHPVICSLLSTLVVIVVSGMNITSALTGDYMTGFVAFIQSNWLMFFAGCIYGVIMQESGAAETIAYGLIKVFGKQNVFYAAAITIALMMLGGINGFVIIFSVWPILVQVFEETNVTRTLIPCLYFIGSGSLANTFPGTPQGLNLVTTGALGVSAAAGLIPGVIGGVVALTLQLVWFTHLVKKSRERGETFNPDGIITEELRAQTLARKEMGRPNLFLSVFPLICCFILVNIEVGGENLFQPAIALFISCFIAFICTIKYLKPKKAIEYLTTAVTQSVNIIIPTCGVMGFAGVVKATTGFAALQTMIPNLPLPPMLSLFVATNIFCAITGTATGSASLVAGILGPIYIQMGLSPEIAARVMVMSASGFDTVPHNGTAVAAIKMAGETHATSYKYMFQCSVLITMIGALTCIAVAFLMGSI